MKTICKLVIIASGLWLTLPALPQTQTASYRPIQISFVPYFGTNGFKTDSIVNAVSINILAGSVYDVRALELGSLVNIVRHDSRGFQAAGLVNLTSRLEGVQAAGLVNEAKTAKGLQLAGLVNQAGGGNAGQVSGLVNHAQDSAGFQMAGLINHARQVETFQVAAMVNNSNQTKTLQVAGLVNQTAGETGIQVSGLVNHARYVKHLQLGVVNIADSTGGFPLGVFNFIKNGYHQLELSANEIFYANVAYRSGIRQFHTIVTAGIDFTNLAFPLWTYGSGLGTTLPVSHNVAIDMDVLFQNVIKGGTVDNNYLYKFDLGVDWHILPSRSLYIGVSYNFLTTDLRQSHYTDYYSDIAPYSIHNRNVLHHNLREWVGFKAALRFF
jgi:hypothetical protein